MFSVSPGSVSGLGSSKEARDTVASTGRSLATKKGGLGFEDILLSAVPSVIGGIFSLFGGEDDSKPEPKPERNTPTIQPLTAGTSSSAAPVVQASDPGSSQRALDPIQDRAMAAFKQRLGV